ncbi:MAG: PilZ domain-containing protein [Planctomycetota bacterium]|nr:PilZ domain-containing protein [Planctomycetota bacterium]
MTAREQHPAERRRHPRTQLQIAVNSIRLDPDGGDVTDTLHMVDISRNGMGAVCDRSFYPGQRLVLCLPLSPAKGRRNIYARVVRCRPREDGYHVGLQFDLSALGAWSEAADVDVAA